MNILHVSDPHFDFAPSDVRDAVLAALDKADFDVVACSGDIANNQRDCAEFLGWFSDIKVPKFLVSGNHDLWWTRRPTTMQLGTPLDGFAGHARRNGWTTPDPHKPWEVVDGVLLFNMFYTPDPAWNSIPRIRYLSGKGGNDLRYSADSRNMYKFDDLVVNHAIPAPGDCPDVGWSMSHMCPSDKIPSFFAPQVCFVNNRILEIAKAHRSPLHLYGHTHELRDTQLGPVRCVNRSWTNIDNKLDVPPSGVVVRA